MAQAATKTETTASFGSILDKPPSETERPRPLPAGSYRCIITERPRFSESAVKKTEFVEFALHPLAAGDDVDEEELAAALTKGDGSVGVLKDKTIRATFYLTDDALWRLKKFLMEDLLIDDLEEIGYRQGIDQSLNREVIAFIKHVPSADGSAVFANLASTAPAA